MVIRWQHHLNLRAVFVHTINQNTVLREFGMTKNPRYKAILYEHCMDADEDTTDLLRRCTKEFGIEKVMSKDFRIEKEKEILPRS